MIGLGCGEPACLKQIFPTRNGVVEGLGLRYRGTVLAVADEHLERTRAALADFVHVRAEWRRARAREWPEDPRNARSADALSDLESWVLALPDSDERLRQLAAYFYDDMDFLPAGENAAQFTSRYGYTFVANPDRFLGAFLALVLDRQPQSIVTDAATQRIDLAEKPAPSS